MNLEKKIKWSFVKDNPDYTCGLDVYNRHYYHLTRGQLQKENHSLYTKIKREGNLNKIPHKYKAWSKKEKISGLLTQLYKINQTKPYIEKPKNIERGTDGPLFLEILN